MEETSKPIEEVAAPADNNWLFVLAALCVGILAWGYLYSQNTNTSGPYLVGYNFGITLFVWLGYRLAAKPPGYQKRGQYPFLVQKKAPLSRGFVVLV